MRLLVFFDPIELIDDDSDLPSDSSLLSTNFLYSLFGDQKKTYSHKRIENGENSARP